MPQRGEFLLTLAFRLRLALFLGHFDVPGEAKSEVVEAVIRGGVVAARRTHVPRFSEPRTPANGVINGRNQTLFLPPVIALLVLRTRPLPDVAQHVIESEAVRRKNFHRGRLLVVPAAAAAIAVGVAAADPITPVTGCPSPGPCRVLPLRLRR